MRKSGIDDSKSNRCSEPFRRSLGRRRNSVTERGIDMVKRSTYRTGWLLAATICTASWVLVAQTPAQNAPAPTATAQPNQGPDQGRQGGPGGGRGRGGPDVLAGGPQLDDPAYANYDFSKKA